MMRFILILLCACATAPGKLAAQERPLVADSDSASVRELTALEHRLNALLNAGDWQSYSPYLADDYRQTNRRGEMRTKREVVNGMQQRTRANFVSTQPDSIEVRVYGNTGILTAVLTGRNADGTTAFRSRILKTFVRGGGKWYMVAMQGTPLP
jgi:ketosteroid isomerase-like protein